MMENHIRNDVSIYFNGLVEELTFLLTDFIKKLSVSAI